MSHHPCKHSCPHILKFVKTRRRRAILEWLKVFCISNFHIKTRFPFLQWVKKYQWKQNIFGDLIAGTIISFIIVVQALAISLIMNVPGEYGIYSSLIGGFVNFLFGTSKDVSIGPSLLAGVIIVRYNPEGSIKVASIIALFNGVIFLLMSLFNFGFLMEFISYPVLKGWISSGAVTIFISQLPSWFGVSIKNMTELSSYELAIEILLSYRRINIADAALGFLAFAVCTALYIVAPMIKRMTSKKGCFISMIGSVLNIVIIARIGWIIGGVSWLGYYLNNRIDYEQQVTFLKASKPGLPVFSNPFQQITYNNKLVTISELLLAIYPSFYLVPIVLLIETLSGARNFGKQFGYQVDNNQELFCLGISNVINSFIGGYSIGAALARTSVNALSGCRSLFSGLITSILLIPIMLYCMPAIGYVSKAALGACICSAALTQIQISSLKHIWKMKILELLPWFATFFCGLYKLEVGMLVGFIVSAAFIMFRELRPRIHGSYDDRTETATLYVKGAIHFPGAYSFSTRLRTMNITHPKVKTIIVDCSHMYETDSSCVEELREAVKSLKKHKINVIIKHLKKGRVYDLFINAGLSDNVFSGFRSNSCTFEFVHTPHLIPYHSNPRDLLPLSRASVETEQFSVSVDINENSQNYLYTVRSIADAYRAKHN